MCHLVFQDISSTNDQLFHIDDAAIVKARTSVIFFEISVDGGGGVVDGRRRRVVEVAAAERRRRRIGV